LAGFLVPDLRCVLLLRLVADFLEELLLLDGEAVLFLCCWLFR
jgi:hypothetical protein